MKLSEKVAYLKGLEEGLALDSAKAETKMFHAIIDALAAIAESVDQDRADVAELSEHLNTVDVDLADLEAFLFSDFDVEPFTEEDLEDFPEADAFTVVYSTDDEAEADADVDAILAEVAVEQAEAEAEEAAIEEVLDDAEDDAAIFAAAEEIVAKAEEEEDAAVVAAAAAATAPVVEEVVEEVAAPVVEEAPAAEEGDVYEVECPTCNEIIYVDDSILSQGFIICPKCQEKLEFDIEYEE